MRNTSIAIALLAACTTTTTVSSDDVRVARSIAHDVSRPLGELALLPQPAPDGVGEIDPVGVIPHPNIHLVTEPDPVLQRASMVHAVPAPVVNFEAMGAGMQNFQAGGFPPDTDGDIGPNHYVQVVNTSVAVFSRTGALLMGPMNTGSVWTGFNGACAQTNDGDATVRYDRIADRWVITQFSISGSTNYQCVAVSTSPDPTGTYARYEFAYDALNDYPKIALWPDAYYFTFNMFPSGGFAGGKVCAMDRTAMVAGAMTASMQCFDSGASYGGLLVSDLDGATPPPAGAPAYVVALDGNTDFVYWQLHVDFQTPANSMFSGPMMVTTASYNPLQAAVQPGGAQLDTLSDRAMNRFVYRRFADHESLLLTHSVASGNGGGIRWYELRTPAMPTVFQQGTFAPDGSTRWMPSIAMDGAGGIAAIYSLTSSSVAPSIRYTGRAATDPAGMMQDEGSIIDGAGGQSSISRWGDYASLNIDPSDDCTFWGTTEYTKENDGTWHTRVAAFNLPSCGTFQIGSLDDEHVAQGGTATYTVQTTTIAGATQSVQLAAMGLPAGVTATFSPATVMSGAMATITLTADASAPLGASHYTVVATGSLSSTMSDVALTVDPEGMGSGSGTGDAKHAGCCSTSDSSPVAPLLLGVGVMAVVLRRRRRT